jgi:hypothetical protein
MFVGTGKPRKSLEREEARELREQGMPIKRIAKALNVSPSSVSYWTRDIQLTPEQQERNLRRSKGLQDPQVVQRRAEEWRRRNQARRLGYQEEGRAQAREGDALHMAGCLLYWAEGAKNRNTIRFVNSDVAMVGFFVRFLRKSLGVRSEQMTLRLNVYTDNGLSIRDIEDHWLDALDLPRTALRGHTLNHAPTSSSGQKRNHLPYGVCCISVLKSTRLVQHIYGAIQEYAEFEEPRWLDGPTVKPRPKRKRVGSKQRGSRDRRASPTRSRARGAPSARVGGSRPRQRPRTDRRTGHPR